MLVRIDDEYNYYVEIPLVGVILQAKRTGEGGVRRSKGLKRKSTGWRRGRGSRPTLRLLR